MNDGDVQYLMLARRDCALTIDCVNMPEWTICAPCCQYSKDEYSTHPPRIFFSGCLLASVFASALVGSLLSRLCDLLCSWRSHGGTRTRTSACKTAGMARNTLYLRFWCRSVRKKLVDRLSKHASVRKDVGQVCHICGPSDADVLISISSLSGAEE